MTLTITGYSTALFSTWFFIEELGLLFDAGDGVTSTLLQKSKKIKHVFISHADRDHLTGLLQLNQLNAREGFPMIHYPKDSGSFPAMADFFAKFDPQSRGTVWNSIKAGDSIEIKKDIVVEAFRNNHVAAPENITKSLSFKVFRVKRKLKKEYQGLSGEEIKNLRESLGNEAITEEIKTNILSYSGDTPVEDYSVYDNSQVLIHEATFLEGIYPIEPRGNRHSTLRQVMEMVSNIHVGTLILSHFSSRYSAEQIDRRITELKEELGIEIPVYRVLPGEIFGVRLGD